MFQSTNYEGLNEMRKVFLCGHTGSANRGCEAIARGTAEVLRVCGVEDITLLTANYEQDVAAGLDRIIRLVPIPRKNLFEKAITYIRRRFFHDKVWGNKRTYEKIFQQVTKDDILFNIGGDTYCYGVPAMSYALNLVAEKYGNHNVFWGCSIDERVLNDATMSADVNRYTAIAVREQLSQNIFQQCIKNPSKIYKICDPAFHLPIEKCALPDGFKETDTLGLNVSPLVFVDENDAADVMYANIYALIDYVLQNTQTNICLIPHVYDTQKNLQDIKILRKVYAKYKQTGRVSIVEDELSCTQLKYVISKCRYFIGARTHATIAAYSTGVPCLAISYSIKSRGIATDLFGTEEGFAIPYKNLKTDLHLKNAFKTVLQEQEEKILARYQEVLPIYKQSIIEETKKLLERSL